MNPVTHSILNHHVVFHRPVNTQYIIPPNIYSTKAAITAAPSIPTPAYIFVAAPVYDAGCEAVVVLPGPLPDPDPLPPIADAGLEPLPDEPLALPDPDPDPDPEPDDPIPEATA